jgi:hypothetical protein
MRRCDRIRPAPTLLAAWPACGDPGPEPVSVARRSPARPGGCEGPTPPYKESFTWRPPEEVTCRGAVFACEVIFQFCHTCVC